MDMPPEEFRRAGHRVVDWIADYLAQARSYPVLPNLQPGDLRRQLPNSAPDGGEPMAGILDDFERQIIPATTHWNHPRFFGYFANSASAPGILAEMLSTALNANSMLWKSAPASTELEQTTLGWLAEALGLPPHWFGIIYDTASVSTMHAIAAAREQAAPEVRFRGGDGRLTLYTSAQSHNSIEKGAITLGIGRDNVRKIPVDSKFRMRADELEKAIAADKAAGKHPFCVVATTGTTSTASIDPVVEIREIARRHGLWMHVDGAYGASAAIVPELRGHFDGVEHADSLVVNPHKWLFAPMDLSVLYTKHPEILKRAFSLSAEYLKTAEDGDAVNYMDYGMPLGRRFRALKLWFILRYFGREGMAERVGNQVKWARAVAKLIEQDPAFEVTAPVLLSLVCFRYRGSNEQNQRLLDRINATGKAFLSHTVLEGRFVLRLSIGNIQTTWKDVEDTWELARSLSADL
jgi:aromatic-L-amino-acid decarboxylase